MKKIYANVSYIFMLLLLTLFSSCGEREDMVMPQVTCDTMTTVHHDPESGIYLLLEDGRVLTPANASVSTPIKGEVNLEINNFPVKEGQQIIMGYVPATQNKPENQIKSGEKIAVTCIVGVAQRTSF